MKNLSIVIVCAKCGYHFVEGENEEMKGFLRLDFSVGEFSFICPNCHYKNEMKMIRDQELKESRSLPKSLGF